MLTNLRLAQWGLTLALITGQPSFVVSFHRKRVEYFLNRLSKESK